MKKPVILLFHPRTLHEKNYRHYHVPYSILAVASTIDKDKFEVILIDGNVQKEKTYHEILVDVADRLRCVGISSMIGEQIIGALSFAHEIRDLKSDCPIVWGGPLPTILPGETVSHELADIAVIGQGEITFQEIVEHLHENKPLGNISGTAHLDENGMVYINPLRPFTDLNVFPSYTTVYPFLDLKEYIWPDEHISERTISYHSSQGCPFSCGFCAEVPLWNRWWCGLSVKRILSDILYLMDNYSVDGIKFYDSEFFVDHKRALDFARELIARKMNIQWGASAHPRSVYKMSDNELFLLRQSGLKRLLVGAESGSSRELGLIGKNINKKMIIDIAERCALNKIVVCFTFVTGYPSLPPYHIDETLEFVRELRYTEPSHEMKLHFYGPYPGTPLYKLALDYGFQPPHTLEEWAHHDYYNILTPWIDPRYAPILRKFNEEYYPYLHPFQKSREGQV